MLYGVTARRTHFSVLFIMVIHSICDLIGLPIDLTILKYRLLHPKHPLQIPTIYLPIPNLYYGLASHCSLCPIGRVGTQAFVGLEAEQRPSSFSSDWKRENPQSDDDNVHASGIDEIHEYFLARTKL